MMCLSKIYPQKNKIKKYEATSFDQFFGYEFVRSEKQKGNETIPMQYGKP